MPVSFLYGKCPKNLYTKVSDRMAYANSADPGSTLFAVPLSILRNNYIKTNFCPKMDESSKF